MIDMFTTYMIDVPTCILPVNLLQLTAVGFWNFKLYTWECNNIYIFNNL